MFLYYVFFTMVMRKMYERVNKESLRERLSWGICVCVCVAIDHYACVWGTKSQDKDGSYTTTSQSSPPWVLSYQLCLPPYHGGHFRDLK